ncbi:MAG: hypothetical protein JJE49_09610 [Peptostreptococcaceae bacterium]|nr:hypothetical protein [Peptostreptococcaceae bacterium]
MTNKFFAQVADKSIARLKASGATDEQIKEEIFLKACLLTSDDQDGIDWKAAESFCDKYWAEHSL